VADSQQSGPAIGVHLVGGLNAPDAEAAMRTAARIVGHHVRWLPDGETGERNQWIGWQLGKLTAVDGINVAGMRRGPSDNPDYAEFPSLSVAPEVGSLPERSLGYADAAETSYPIFRRLREEGVVGPAVKFQVSIPTPYATVAAWAKEEDQERFFAIYEAALAAEVADIARTIPPDDLVIQYDVAVEIGVLTGNMGATAKLAQKSFVVDALRRVLAWPPAGIERGVHLCYGDYKHRHFTVPEDLSLCVDLANAVGDQAEFVHMPADRETGRSPAYFEPLRDLTIQRLALGVVDYEGSEERTRELISAATTGAGDREFAVATECGMARIDERDDGGPTLERLLELHAATATPIW
jgi:methionine synthase II (cobalamin-independent)